MPAVKKTVTIGAGETVNIMAGSQYEYLNFPAYIQIALMAAASDVVAGLITTGTDLLLNTEQLDEKAVTLPLTTEDVQFTDTVLPGERIVVQVTGTAAGDVVRALVNITPL